MSIIIAKSERLQCVGIAIVIKSDVQAAEYKVSHGNYKELTTWLY
jgi:hypothetical protein